MTPGHIPANVLKLILSMREDLRALGFDQPHKAREFAHWLTHHGMVEYPVLQDLAHADPRVLGQEMGRGPGQVHRQVHRQVQWQDLGQTHAQKHAQTPHPFGVNLIGYAFGELGIGEDVRMAARALLANRVPFTMLDFKPGDDIPQNDRSMAKFVSNQSRYAVNLFCMTAQENARHFLTQGQGQYVGRYNIGYWPWELSGWPHDWALSFDLVDEVWVSTWHTYQALADICPKPLFRMPMAVETPEVTAFADLAQARSHFALPLTATLFCFSFDFNSSIHRKNPQACVDAFLNAFPRREFNRNEVGLVIKVHTPKQPNEVWKNLTQLMRRDDRIHVIEETLSKPDLLALYQSCDCFVSLHRAEGFGRGIAEALKLGLHVITTGYSGNVDFCQAPYADLVDYTLVPVGATQYPYAEGQVWAEPDVDHAAHLMRAFVNRSRAAQAAPKHINTHWPEFSAKVVGKRYVQRLVQIQAENPELFDTDSSD